MAFEPTRFAGENPRAIGINPRATETSLRDRGINPRALGTNQRAVAETEVGLPGATPGIRNRHAFRNWKRAQRKGTP